MAEAFTPIRDLLPTFQVTRGGVDYKNPPPSRKPAPFPLEWAESDLRRARDDLAYAERGLDAALRGEAWRALHPEPFDFDDDDDG